MEAQQTNALIDDAGFVRVKKLNRVFDGKNMVAALAVDLIDHGGERR